MAVEIEGLEQKWEEWRWAKRKGMIREEEFPEAERLLIRRSWARTAWAAEENGDMKELAKAYPRLHQGLSSPLNLRGPERTKDEGVNGRSAVSASLSDRQYCGHAHGL